MTDARVILWGRDIGAVSWVENQEIGVFQYAKDFTGSNIEAAPLMMPLRDAPYQFPGLNKETFKGLPGMLADSLPDKFGNRLIDAWLASEGRLPGSMNPVERLCYTGARGMGALEFKPVLNDAPSKSRKVEVNKLVELANRVLDERTNLNGKFTGVDDKAVIEDILRVGTSAGGARAKAILAWNEKTGEFRSGQVSADEDFTYWLMKFDGVDGNSDKELADPLGYGRIEYAYHLMAVEAGIAMERCRLHEEGGRAHFMTRRFDRGGPGEKLHMQTLGAMMHFDFNQAGAYSYEQALQTIRRLNMPMIAVEEQFRRTVFNVIARNQDDHVKNIAFLMDQRGEWRLSPAYDVAYSYSSTGLWTNRHQMSINGKRDEFEYADLIALSQIGGIKEPKAKSIIADVAKAIRNWSGHAVQADIAKSDVQRIEKAFRLYLVENKQ